MQTTDESVPPEAVRDPVRLVLLLSLLFCCVSIVPLLIGDAIEGQSEFLGLATNPGDQWVYLSWVEQSRQGSIGAGNLYDPAPSRPLFFNLVFCLLGWLGRMTGLSSVQAYTLGRLLLIPLFGLVLWRLLRQFIDGARIRVGAMIWIYFGTGLGWAMALHHVLTGLSMERYTPRFEPWMPADLWMPELNFFTSSLNFPTLTCGYLLLALAMSLHYEELASPTWRGSARTGVVGCVLGFAHIYPVIVFLAVACVSVFMWHRRLPTPGRLQKFALSVGLTSIPFLYYVVTFSIEPWLKDWSSSLQGSPSPTVYVLGFGLAAPLAIWRLATEESNDPRFRFLKIWVIVQSLLLYSGPFLAFERRLVEGLQIPVVMVAAEALARLCRDLPSTRLAKLLVAVVAAASLPSGLYVIVHQCQLDVQDPEYFRSPAEVLALRTLPDHVEPGAVVLCVPETGLMLPALACRKVLVGQNIHSEEFEERIAYVEAFFRGQGTLEQRGEFLKKYGISYIYWGDMEARRGPPPPDEGTLVKLVSAVGTCRLYRVKVTGSPAPSPAPAGGAPPPSHAPGDPGGPRPAGDR